MNLASAVAASRPEAGLKTDHQVEQLRQVFSSFQVNKQEDYDEVARALISKVTIAMPGADAKKLTEAFARQLAIQEKNDTSDQSTLPTSSASDQEGTDVEFSVKDKPTIDRTTWSSDSQSSRGLDGSERFEDRNYNSVYTGHLGTGQLQNTGQPATALLNQQRVARPVLKAKRGTSRRAEDTDGVGNASCTPVRPRAPNAYVGKRTPSATRSQRQGKRATPVRNMFVSNNTNYISQVNTGISPSSASNPRQHQPSSAPLFSRLICKSQRDDEFEEFASGDTSNMSSSQQLSSGFSSFNPSFPSPSNMMEANHSSATPGIRRQRAPNSPTRPGLEDTDDNADSCQNSSPSIQRKRPGRANFKFPSSEDEDGTEPISAPPRESLSPGDPFAPMVQTVESKSSESPEIDAKTPAAYRKDASDFPARTPMDFSFTSPPLDHAAAQREASDVYLDCSRKKWIGETPAPESFRAADPFSQKTPAPVQQGQSPIGQSTPFNTSVHRTEIAGSVPPTIPPMDHAPGARPTGTQLNQDFGAQYQSVAGSVPAMYNAQPVPPFQSQQFSVNSSTYTAPQPPMQHQQQTAAMPQAQQHGQHIPSTTNPPFQPQQPGINAQEVTFNMGRDKLHTRLQRAKARVGRAQPVQAAQSSGGSSSEVRLNDAATFQTNQVDRVPSPMNVDVEEPVFSLGKEPKEKKSRFKLPNKNLLRKTSAPVPAPAASSGTSKPSEVPEQTQQPQEQDDFSHVLALITSKREEARDAFMRQDYRSCIKCCTIAIRSLRSLHGKNVFNGDALAALLDKRASALMMLGAASAAADDCRAALAFISNGGENGENFSNDSGPPFRIRLQNRLLQALLKGGQDREAFEVGESALQSVKNALAFTKEKHPKEQAEQNVMVLEHLKRETELDMEIVKKVQEHLDAVRKHLRQNDSNSRWSYSEPLRHVELALTHENASDELIGTKVRLLTKMKRWREAVGFLERYAALNVRLDDVFVGDLEFKNPFPGVQPAKELKVNFFEEKSFEDCRTADKKLNSRAAAEAVLRIPYNLTQIYVRGLRLQERYPAAELALNALEDLASSGNTKFTVDEMREEFKWISAERDRVRRTKEKRELADEHYRTGRFLEASDAYAECLEIDKEGQRGNTTDGPNAGGRLHAVVHCNRAAALMAADKHEQALEECTHAIHIHSTYMKAMIRRARCFTKLMRFQEAISEYTRWLDLVREAKKRTGPQPITVCLFDEPNNVSESDFEKARQELEAVHIQKRRAEAAAREATSRRNINNMRWNQQFNNAHTAQERREHWYHHENSRRWDSFSKRGPRQDREYKRSASAGPGMGDSRAYSNNDAQQEERSHQRQHSLGSPTAVSNMDHYAVLDVSVNATEAEIKKAYYKLALKYHPDKNPNDKAKELFVRVKEAFEILTDTDRRRQYDSERTRRHY